MKIDKARVLMLSGWFIVVALFNVIVFTLFDDRNNVFWLAYSFAMAAFFIQIGAYFLAYINKSAKNEFIGYPITSLSVFYQLIQLSVSLYFMSAQDLSAKPVVVVQVVILGGYLLVLIMLVLGTDSIKDKANLTKSKTDFIKSLLVEVECLAGKTDDTVLKKALAALADSVKYSDPMSVDSLAMLENKITAKVAELSNAVEGGDTGSALEKCKTLEMLIVERNKKSKALK